MATPDLGPGRGPVGIQTSEAVTPTPLGRLPGERVANTAPPITIPQGRRRTGERSPWMKRIALATGGAILLGGGGYLASRFLGDPGSEPSPSPIVTPGQSPWASESPSIEPPTAQPTPEPTPSAIPTATETPVIPTATPKLETPTPYPTPSDPVWQEWNSIDEDNWTDEQGAPDTLATSPDIPGSKSEHYLQGEIVRAERGNVDNILYVGMKDVAGNKFTVAFRISAEHVTTIGVTNSKVHGSGEDSHIDIRGDESLNTINNNYIRSLTNFIVYEDIETRNPSLKEDIRKNAQATKELWQFIQGTLSADYRSLDVPSFVNSSNIDEKNLPFLFQFTVYTAK